MRHFQAYRGYLITCNVITNHYYITKDGCLIATTITEAKAKDAIDGLLVAASDPRCPDCSEFLSFDGYCTPCSQMDDRMY